VRLAPKSKIVDYHYRQITLAFQSRLVSYSTLRRRPRRSGRNEKAFTPSCKRRIEIDKTHVAVLRSTERAMVPTPEMAAFAERFGFCFLRRSARAIHLYLQAATQGKNAWVEVGIYRASSRSAGADGFCFSVRCHAEGMAATCAPHAPSG
jgi:hypothetical protein